MNKVILMGRLTADPEVRYSQGENAICIARYNLAVDRKYKRDGEQQADFPRCVALGKAGEFAEKYLHKGMRIAIVGRITTGSYTNHDGQKVYTTEVTVEEHYFTESKALSQNSTGGGYQQSGGFRSGAYSQADSDGFMNVPDDEQEGLPF